MASPYPQQVGVRRDYGGVEVSGPKTTEDAVALPEMKGSELMGGDIFLGCGICGDTIIAFVDDDGVSKKVECIRRSLNGPDEWVKVIL